MEKTKAKREIPDNTPDWLHPLLLKEPMAHTANAPIDVVSDALHTLEIPSTSFFQQRARTVQVEFDDDGEQTFTIAAKRRARSMYTDSAVCRGVLVPDGANTQVIGYSRLTLVAIGGLIAPVVGTLFIVIYMVGAFTFMRLALSYLLIFFLMIVIVLGFTYWRFTQMRNDREEIIGALNALIYRELPNKAKHGADN